MSNDAERLGSEPTAAQLYRKVLTPVYSDDGKFYTAGCVIHGDGGAVKIVFLRYEDGKGIVGRCRPSAEMAALLKNHGQKLKAYLEKMEGRDG